MNLPDALLPRPRRRILQNTAFSVMMRGQSALFTYLSTYVLLHALSVEDYGLHAVLLSGALLDLSLIVQLGIPSLITRFMPDLYTAGRWKTIVRVFRAARRIQLAVAVGVLISVLIFADTIAGWLNYPGYQTVLRVFSVGALSYLIQDNYLMLLSALFRQKTIFAIGLIYNSLRLTALFVLTRYTHELVWVIALESALLLLSQSLYVLAFHRTIKPLAAADSHEDEPLPVRRYVRYAGLCYLSEIGVVLLSEATDLFLVTGILGAAAVAMYGLSNRIVSIVLGVLPGRLLKNVIEPFFFSEYGSANPQAARSGFNLLTKATLLVSLPVSIWLTIMSRPVITHFFNPDYAAAAPIVAVAALFLHQTSLRLPLGLMLQNAERIDLLIYAKISGVLKIVFGIWLVPQYGVTAMVWITGLASLLQNLIMYYYVVTRLRVHAHYAGVIRLAMNALLSAVIFLPLARHFESPVAVALSAPLYATLFVALCLVNRAFTAEERALINSRLPYQLWRF